MNPKGLTDFKSISIFEKKKKCSVPWNFLYVSTEVHFTANYGHYSYLVHKYFRRTRPSHRSTDSI